MNIGIVLPYMKAGGTERQARYIARHLERSGHRVRVMVAEAKGTFWDEVEDIAISLDVPFSKPYTPLLVYRLVQAVRKQDFDLILSRAWNTNMITATTGLLTGVPYVLFLSGSTDRKGQPRLKLSIEKYFLRNAERIISVSEAAKENCIQAYGLPPSLIRVIHNGIKVDEIQRSAEQYSADKSRMQNDKFNIVFVGRVTPRKGLDVLLRAIATVDSDVKVWVIGDGKTGRYEKIAKDLGVREQVSFLGRKENPFPELENADLFVLPSRSEGFPNVLLEAMALGQAVLASDCSTGPDEIIDGRNGQLFPVEDHDTLSQMICNIMGRKKERIVMGKEARLTVKEEFKLDDKLSEIEYVLKNSF
ncbi:glycosyltransferase involved in cell wall biosynthesis [Salinibacter ruber]|uniref:glycosyltransferase n=1 Tax=Salinibacter ruber TaxID=146919 RepID=UPI0021674226|nr:glycosyltransferase [Salinibacter ruber]MCS3826463.1 glycosyltransferase involved in cell wall biosynthesis [Salinibacter ruber]